MKEAGLRAASEDGSVLVVTVVLVLFLLGLAASLTMASIANAKARIENSSLVRAFYVADSGAQMGIARVRASGGTAGESVIAEDLSGGSAVVEITTPNPDLYVITSKGTYSGYERTVEVRMTFTGQFEIPGAFSAMFSRGAELTARMVGTSVLGTATLSGMDHSRTGERLADQSLAVPALAMNTVPGDRTFNVEQVRGSSTVEGYPVVVDNNAENMSPILEAIRDKAAEEADIKLLGSRVLGTRHSGQYGTPDAPALVYARLRDSEALELGERFKGYGTLVVDAETYGRFRVLRMRDFASWHGLVVVYLAGESRVTAQAVVRVSDEAQIIGALTTFINVEVTEVTRSGKLLHSTENGRILFSSEIVRNAFGIERYMTGRVVSYRMP